MKANLKPLHFTIYSAIALTLLSDVLLYILLQQFYGEANSWLILIFSLVIFLLFFFLIYFYFKYNVFRNFNAILKSINSHGKQDVKEKNLNFKVNIMEDIDQKVKVWIDENKKEIDKYRILSEYRTQFLGDISHELKTPLFSIQGYLHTLLDGALYDKKKNLVFLQRAIKNTDRLESIVSDLDMISKLETGEMKYNFGTFKISKIFQEVFEELDYAASSKNIKLQFKSDSKKEVLVQGDKKQIRHVCSNLVSNAIHYGNTNGFVKIGVYPEGQFVGIEVSDNGIGIEQEHIKHLFDRFYRIDVSRSRNLGGSGLGLSIVKHILKAHDQEIKVESQPGKGSTFSFSLLSGSD